MKSLLQAESILHKIQYKIFYTILIFLFTSPNAFAQNLSSLDESFLEGLPPSLRESLEIKNSNEDEASLEQLFRADSSLEKNKVILKKLYDQLQALDQRFDLIDSSEQDTLPRFGDNFFSSIQSSFMPVNVPNMASEYVVDVGDKFNLILTGMSKSDSDIFVQRDGTLMIPDIGKVFVAGKTLSETTMAVEKFAADRAIGSMPFISLSEIRDMQILLMGGVESPGIYTISGGSSILAALNVAGGIAKNGSFRKVEHRRGDNVLETLDLYDIFINGKNPFIGNLRSGDIIFVHPSSFLVPITGGVTSEALFEILPNETMHDALKFAGGFSEGFAGFTSLSLQRNSIKTQQILEIPLDQISAIQLNARDSILVPSYVNYRKAQKKVTITGMVHRPGEYFIREGETLSSLIKRSGGFKAGAYIFGSALFRQDALEKEKSFAQLNYSDTVNYIVSNIGRPNSSINSSALELLSEELRSKQYSGRILADFNTSLGVSDQSITLQDQDMIVIPKMQRVIYMFGDFKKPTNLQYSESASIADYIDLSGGLKNSAFKEVVVIDPDGKTHLYPLGRFSRAKNIDLYPGSIIYAPRNIGKISGINYASTVSPIISSLALSIASLNSIKN